MRRHASLIAVSLLFTSAAFSQEHAALSPTVREYVKVDSPVVAITHVRVIDGTGAAPRADQTLVLRRGRIEAIGDSSTAKIPAGAKVLEFKGYSVIPGLVGMHDHIYYPAPLEALPMYPEHASSFPALYLAGGVTTIRTTGSVEPYTDLELKRLIDAGAVAGPRVNVTGPYLEGRGSFTPQMHELRDEEDARRTVEYWIDEGVTSFKAYMHITPGELAAAVKAAHAHGIKVTGHLCSIGFREAAAIGIDDLEHGLLVDTEFSPAKKPGQCPENDTSLETLDLNSTPVQEMIGDLVTHHVAVTSTLPVFETFVPNRAPISKRVLNAMHPETRAAYLSRRAKISDAAAKSKWPGLFRKEMEFERAFAKAGGLLLAGLDPTGYGGAIPGFGDQREVELLVEAGFTPVEAIHIATSNGATFLGQADKIGTLEAGKIADLVVIHGDPSTSIGDIENVEIVFKDGVGYDCAKLIESARGLVGLN